MTIGNKIATDEINRYSASQNPNFVKVDFGIRKTDDETRNIISSTFGVIKNNISALWNSVGLEPNVNMAYEQAMQDPNSAIEVKGKTFFPHPGVGNLQPYNEAGNPAGGCFTMQTLA